MIEFAVIIFVTGFQIISSKEIDKYAPPECMGPPVGIDRPEDCCKFPPFFRNSDYIMCGFVEQINENDDAVPDCSKQICLMKRYNLIHNNYTVDMPALKKFLESWAADYPAFKPAVSLAEARCIDKPITGLNHLCEPNRVVFCVNMTLFTHCPHWEKMDKCALLQTHIEKCDSYAS